MSEISIIDQLSAPYAKRKLVKTMMIGFVVKNARMNGNYLTGN
jgi:hypothetical protein